MPRNITRTPPTVTTVPRICWVVGTRSKKTTFRLIDMMHDAWKMAVVGPARPFTVQFRPTKLVSMWRELVTMQIRQLCQL